MKKRNAVAALALAVAIAIGSAACGDDDGNDAASDDSGSDAASNDGRNDAASNDGDDNTTEHSREDYVGLMGGGGEGLSDEEANCISAAVVDVVGVDALEQVNAWDKMQENPDGSLADYGVVVDQAQITAIADGVGACVDAPGLFEEMLMADDDVSPELAACLASGLDVDTLHRIVAITIVQGEAALDADPNLTSDVEQAGVDCAAQGIT